MLFLERRLLYVFDNGQKEEALIIYRQLIAKAQDHFKTLRELKNYLISLNSSLYELAYKKPICKKNLQLMRFKFTESIESTRSFKALISLGETIIESYMENNIRCLKLNPIINNAINYIDQHLEDDLTLSSVAESINVSKNYLSLLFSNTLDISFSNFVNKGRIDRAKILLETTDYCLLDIALQCGFNSQSYFCYSFKNQLNQTATDYRKQVNQLAI